MLEIDTDQVKKVQKFRQKLPNLGVLYKEFSNNTDFIKMIRADIVNIIANQWQEDRWDKVPDIVETTSKTKETTTEEILEYGNENSSNISEVLKDEIETNNEYDDGDEKDKNISEEKQKKEIALKEENLESQSDDDFFLFETLQDLYESNESMIQNLNNMTQHTNDLGNVVTFQSEQINHIISRMALIKNSGGEREKQKLVSSITNVLNKIADEMESYLKNINPYVSSLPSEINKFLQNYKKLFEYEREKPNQQKEEIEQAFDTLESFVGTMQETKNSMEGFRSNVVEIPAFTRRFKRARKNTADSLGKLVEALTKAIDNGRVILSELDGQD